MDSPSSGTAANGELATYTSGGLGAARGMIQPGDDVLVPLRQRLQATTESIEFDPIGQLPTGFRISMFTLCAASAERARQATLLGRNADLDIRLCHETDMNFNLKVPGNQLRLSGGSYRLSQSCDLLRHQPTTAA